ncbi:hypothetical protein D1AOALGA4SA_6374 [Olavius algarvensis Delta 1 endosymbiont]|nr:hypothetical protein D1AOALGA4SA_6374 [Olavius algarvensis Delta 1 endosymbiont]
MLRGFTPPFQAELYRHQRFGAPAPPNSLILVIFLLLMAAFLMNHRLEKF